MISTRVKRGAIRTHLLIRNTIEQYAFSPAPRPVSTVRSSVLSGVATWMALMPMAAATPTPTALAAGPGESEPPSIVRADSPLSSAISSLISYDTSTPAAIVASEGSIFTQTLQTVAQGKSLATEAEEAAKAEAERIAAEERQKKEAAAAAAKKAQEARKAAAAKQQATIILAASFSGSVVDYVHQMTVQAFGEDQWPAMSAIISRESGFNPNSYNKRSGACGLFQAMPCSKMGGMEVGNQVRWGIGYIRARYGTPSAAWAFWQRHHWY